ncbi:hypothetical protein L596_004937 [Steinernema carpocapsae]|uniref:Uncharacterized protein n=1 Tax=Steinernema carpocapsae TaxID=34508 RepID=A0A4U8UXC2_STECR|nr:hypothetical protein L596_004937 [Steinernema carpocapsae]
MDDWTVNGTESAQQDENPIQQKTSADDEITANLLTVNSRKMSEELVAVEDPQTGPIMEVFETATPETNIVRTTRPEKTGTIDDRIQNIENMIHTVESLIGNNTDKTVNNISIVELLTTEATTIPAVRSEQKKEEHYEGHCDDDKTPEVPTAEKKIDDFLSTLRAFLARNKLKDLSKIANAKNSNKTLVERLKEAVQNNARELKVEDEGAGKKTENGPEEPKGEQGDESEKENEESKERKTEAKEKETEVKEPKIEESKQQANEEKKQKKEEAKEQNGGQVQMKKLHSNEIEKELSSVLGDSISENISSSSTEAKAVTIINEMKQPKKKSGRWEVQHNEPFQDEAKASDLNHNATVKIHSAPSISKEVQVDDPKTTLSAGSLFPALPKIDPKNPPVESEESEKRRQDLREKTDAIYKQFSERLDTSKLIERIRQNELARKRISTDRVESLAAPAPSTQHNVNAFFEMEKLFSDIGKNFKRFLATRI